MKSLKWLWMSILADAGIRCDTDTHRDIKTISRRIKHEGVSFLTISLPTFCSDFERSLAEGGVGSNLFQGYRRRFGLPVFLQGFLSQVFDPVSGRLLVRPSTDAIFSIRQACLMWKKVELPCSNSRTRSSINAYVQAEVDLRGLYLSKPVLPTRQFRNVSGIIWGSSLGRISRVVSDLKHTPRHGPGAVQERGLRGNRKYRSWNPDLPDGSGDRKNSRSRVPPSSGGLEQSRWHPRLEPYFPFDAFCVSNAGVLASMEDSSLAKDRDPDAESPVRVITVPKTQKGPRIIAIEPLCMQYTQQSLMETMVDTIESHGLSAGHVNFSDQSINRKLASRASKSGEFATLDLSEASDRVPLALVCEMLSSAPFLRDAILACRSTHAELPNGDVLPLVKFASMGSALCFPIESMVFFTIAIISGLKSANLPATPRNVKHIAESIYVYGDDIIIPVGQVETTIVDLKSFGLKVNTNKSFWTGKFRESCGMDAYDGVNVTPVYVRRLPPNGRRNVPEMLSFVSLANQLYDAGWWGTAGLVRDFCESILGPLPHVLESSPCLGWISVNNTYSVQRWNSELHRFEVKAPVVQSIMYSDHLDGDGALMKYFLKRGEEPSSEEHLERSVRPGCARIKSRWASPC